MWRQAIQLGAFNNSITCRSDAVVKEGVFVVACYRPKNEEGCESIRKPMSGPALFFGAADVMSSVQLNAAITKPPGGVSFRDILGHSLGFRQ